MKAKWGINRRLPHTALLHWSSFVCLTSLLRQHWPRRMPGKSYPPHHWFWRFPQKCLFRFDFYNQKIPRLSVTHNRASTQLKSRAETADRWDTGTISLYSTKLVLLHWRYFMVGIFPRAIRCVRKSRATEPKRFASRILQMPKSCDFLLVLPLGGLTQSCAQCWTTGKSRRICWRPLGWRWIFQTSSRGRNPAKNSYLLSSDALQENQNTQFYSLLTICFQFFCT